MMKLLTFGTLVTLTLLVFPALAAAQVATTTSRLAWDQAGPDLATVTTGYTYRYCADLSATGTCTQTSTPPAVPLTGVACVAPVPPATTFACDAAFPAFTPASHTVAVIASSGADDSAPSNTITFRFAILPAASVNLHIKAGR